MTATNHALTGAIIGLSVHQPVLAIVLAFASHFVLDAIPHAGELINMKSIAYKIYLLCEALICGLIVLYLAYNQPNYWWLGALCAFAAASPDFMWVKGYIAILKGKKAPKPHNWLVKLHTKIQWYQKPMGLLVEITWAILAVSLLAILVKK